LIVSQWNKSYLGVSEFIRLQNSMYIIHIEKKLGSNTLRRQDLLYLTTIIIIDLSHPLTLFCILHMVYSATLWLLHALLSQWCPMVLCCVMFYSSTVPNVMDKQILWPQLWNCILHFIHNKTYLTVSLFISL